MDTISHLAPAASTAPHRPPTILDYIGRRVTHKCSECGSDIAVRWVPRAWETSELDAWADHEDVLFNRCHVCALKAAPEEYHATLKARFDHILQVHDRLKFHTLQPGRSGSMRPTPVTTTYTTWYPVNRAGQSYLYVEEFFIAGYLLDGFDADAARRVLSPSPPYHIYSHEEPLGSGLRTLVAAVCVTLHVRVPAVPNAYLEWRWDPYDQALAWEPMIRGFSGVSADEIRRLAYDGRRLFAIHRASSGRYPDEDEIVCGGFKRDLDHVIPQLRDDMLYDEGSPSRPLEAEAACQSPRVFRPHPPDSP